MRMIPIVHLKLNNSDRISSLRSFSGSRPPRFLPHPPLIPPLVRGDTEGWQKKPLKDNSLSLLGEKVK